MNILTFFVLALVLGAVLSGSGDTHYVWQQNPLPVPPYMSWATAATNIQDAVDASSDGDTVLVTNGVYDTGGRAIHGMMTNRVAVDRAIRLESVTGPEATIIEGYQVPGTTNGDGAIRCVYLTNGASLIGFTLTNGATRLNDTPEEEQQGGGVWCESISALVSNSTLVGNSASGRGGGSYDGTSIGCLFTSNSAAFGGGADEGAQVECMFIGNWASSWGGGAAESTLDHCTLTNNSAHKGGGADHGTLRNCLLTGNSADIGGGSSSGKLTNCVITGNSANYGGGSDFETLRNCTLTGNSANHGGASFRSALINCIAYHNSASGSGDNYFIGSQDYSCVTPLPAQGTGNITNVPLFVDTNGWSDLRLQPNSPCINAGSNAYVTTTNDLGGSLRIVGSTVDVGAYEYQTPSSVVSYAWLQQYGLPNDGSVDFIDGDGDGAVTWSEWKAWTVPTNKLSVLRMLHPDPQTNGTAVAWQSVDGHSYTLERAQDSAANFTVLVSDIVGNAGATTFIDPTVTNGEALFYRVSVQD